ncbi:MAG: histidine ammonia-lyase [Candidatus Latescibacteria bacterium]|nr:histidine ammonia-lyase [Candidatus Latescibacterota bacterium]NIO29057.1 histidine ammonia-lyase [Candidatus Latescibacterota bacterium]NIO56682.1 histidine ammonia-lyase [Candidatus Latescibacterota bacterium]NIT02265.1 histidine ammonia-lyase [Candidatus Latescibacterota bacterium]NIT39150.1 histidine ammonia-lyase [Candidatus Latescibacterota bacterium]
MPISITGKGLTIDDVVAVSRRNEKVELHPDAIARINKCREFVEERIEAREIMYGVNTGIGEFSEVILNDEQVRQFQRYLIYNHAAGIGEPCPIEHVRAAMLLRANVLALGYSACRLEIAQTFVDMLNKGVTPVVCEKGSVGASGDLAPMSQIALLMMGEGEAFLEGKRMPGHKALEEAGIPVPGLEARDGLAAINGSNLTNGIGCLVLYDTERWLLQTEIAAAMTLEALQANMKPYDRRLHELRGFPGAVTSSDNIRKVIEGSDLVAGKRKVKVQDAYSMRSTPQVLGAARDQMRWTRWQLEIEANGVGDNPVFLPDDKVVLTGANFQGTPISIPLDTLGGAICMVCVISERRLNRLTNPALSMGLPAFLTKGAGMFSGMMLSQYTADMQIVEQRILSGPAFNQSIPAAADQEDFVSMGLNSALKTRQILENAYGVLGIEFMAAAQALDFRDYTPGRGTLAAKAEIRKHVDYLDEDRPLYPDHNAMKALVKSLDILKAVQSETGELSIY